jgi:hypothetical protein
VNSGVYKQKKEKLFALRMKNILPLANFKNESDPNAQKVRNFFVGIRF